MVHRKLSQALPSDSAQAQSSAAHLQQQLCDEEQKPQLTKTVDFADPQQTELLYAMQNVTGRFIRNAIVQMRKRAAGLCVEELKEYKRSKMLNVLQGPGPACTPPSRPSSASYLVPAAPGSCAFTHASQPGLSGMHHNSTVPMPCTTVQVSGQESSKDASLQRELPCSSQRPSSTGAEQLPSSAHALLGRQVAGSGDAMLSEHAGHLDSRVRTSNAADDMDTPDDICAPHSDDLQCSSASMSLDSSGSDLPQPSAGEQKVQPALEQAAFPAWAQHTSQPLEEFANSWSHEPPRPPLQFSPTKLACASTFSFSKQPCPVIW